MSPNIYASPPTHDEPRRLGPRPIQANRDRDAPESESTRIRVNSDPSRTGAESTRIRVYSDPSQIRSESRQDSR